MGDEVKGEREGEEMKREREGDEVKGEREGEDMKREREGDEVEGEREGDEVKGEREGDEMKGEREGEEMKEEEESVCYAHCLPQAFSTSSTDYHHSLSYSIPIFTSVSTSTSSQLTPVPSFFLLYSSLPALSLSPFSYFSLLSLLLLFSFSL